MRRSKRSMTGLDLAALMPALSRRLEGGVIANVYGLGEAVILKVSKGGGRREWLVLHPRAGAWLTRYELEGLGYEHPLVRGLRKAMRGGRILAAWQAGLDRVLFIEVEAGGSRARLVLEFVREGNILLVRDGKVELALREREMRDRVVKRGEAYVPPPRLGLDPLTLTPDDYELASAKGRLTAAALLSRAISAPGEAVAEALFRAGLDPRARVKKLSRGAFEAFARELREVYVEALEGACYVVDGAFYPFKPLHLGGGRKASNLLEVVDDALTPRLYSEEGGEGGPHLHALERAKEYEEEAARLRAAAQGITARAAEFERVLAALRRLRGEGISWDEIARRVAAMHDAVRRVDPSKMEVEVEVAGVRVVLKASESIWKNIERIYEEAKDLERRARRAREVAKRLEVEARPKARPRPLKLRRERAWYEGFRYFFSSEGFLVVGGKDASQNEALVKKYMGANDLFFHADIHGAPAVIVKVEGRELGPATIEEAAQFAASFSRAWQLGLMGVDVYWVRGEQVSKRAPSGEYLGRGAFMVYGKRNYLRRVPLALAVGLRVEDDGFKLVCGPVRAVESSCDVAVVLRPGRISKDVTAAKVASALRKLAREALGVNVKINPSDIAALLPSGGFLIESVKVIRSEGRAGAGS